jgi:hypothetical protein
MIAHFFQQHLSLACFHTVRLTFVLCNFKISDDDVKDQTQSLKRETSRRLASAVEKALGLSTLSAWTTVTRDQVITHGGTRTLISYR